MASVDSSMAKLQQENAELRVALQQAQQQAEAAAAAYSIPMQQQHQLQALLGQREAQVQGLRAQVQQLEQRLEAGEHPLLHSIINQT
jgi:predicted nuclease with TOPRIM domain